MQFKAVLVFAADVTRRLNINGSQIYYNFMKSLAKPITSRVPWLWNEYEFLAFFPKTSELDFVPKLLWML